MTQPATLTRMELYSLVWQKSAVKLAREFGVSDVAIAKACRRHKIPRPPRGYWARREAGKQVRRPPLPNPTRNTEIRIGRFANLISRHREYAENSRPVKPVHIRSRLAGLHPLVQETKDYLERYDAAEYWNRPHGRYLDVSTSKQSRRRALLIMDALIRALEERGHHVELLAGSGDCWETCAVIDNIKVEFRLEERTSWHAGTPATRMLLKILQWNKGARREWRDGKKQRVESILPEFILALELEALYMREEIENEKARELKQEEERTRRKATVDYYLAEEARVAELLRQAEKSDKAESVRRYISAVRDKARKKGPINPESETAKWLEWAAGQADRIDPLADGPESVLDNPPPPDWYRDDRGLYRWTPCRERYLFNRKAED